MIKEPVCWTLTEIFSVDVNPVSASAVGELRCEVCLHGHEGVLGVGSDTGSIRCSPIFSELGAGNGCQNPDNRDNDKKLNQRKAFLARPKLNSFLLSLGVGTGQ